MSHKFLSDAKFHLLLTQIDNELAQEAAKKGCPHCGKQLNQSNYPRSPFGLLAAFRCYYDSRLSFCCAKCRQRLTPPSVRFFGRRWFVAPVFLLICLFRSGINERRLDQVWHHFAIRVSESTWKRWRRWWRELFEATPFWNAHKGLVAVTLNEGAVLPRSLLASFKQGTLPDRVCSLLQFLSPLTGGVFRAV